MLTVEFTTFWPEQQALKQECIDFMAMNAGVADCIAVHLEDPADPESSFAVLFHFKELNMDDFPLWDELKEFAAANELYVLAYDHHSNRRRGYWYDEEDEWIVQELDKHDYVTGLVA